MDPVDGAPLTESDPAAVRTQDRAVRLFTHYLATLGYDGASAAGRAAALVAECPHAQEPARALRWLDDRVDRWLATLAPSLTRLPRDAERLTARVALTALAPGGDWPDALFNPQPPAAFIDAFRQALPIALPPPAPLAMPEQRLEEAGERVVKAGSNRELWRAFHRRLVLATLALGTAGLAAFEMGRVFAPGGIEVVEALLIVLFGANFIWIALNFWSALAGLLVGLLAGARLPSGLISPQGPLTTLTALVMPIYNEHPARVFAAVETMYRSLAATGELAHFEFFLLSDTTDTNLWVAEELGWDQTRQRLGASGRLFYRRRADNAGRKAGNIAEFCRRWGARYEAMVVLDADSVMSGSTIVELAALMQANPHAGILQTIPRLANRNTPFARAHQFAGACYGPVLARGLSWWYLGAGNYWGHNAIIRVRAFADHAGMPLLSGGPPFGGHIFSHDFVEAALMRRAGWRVYLLPGADGSYEESPPSLIDHALRDRRWCQGNLQHLRVIGAAGLHPLSRLHLVTGVMAYLASPLWFAFILVGIGAALQTRFELPEYFFPDRTPYPVWHVTDPALALRLFLVTMAILLAPKLFGWLYLAANSMRARAFGGRLRALSSVVFETAQSTLLAPMHMLFQTRFVFEVFTGRDSGWNAQSRDDQGTRWSDAWIRHHRQMLVGIVLAAAASAIYPGLVVWLAPALLGMLLAVPLSVWTSRSSVGLRLRRVGLLLTPEESDPPAILTELARARAAHTHDASVRDGLGTVVLERHAGLLHLALLAADPPALLSDASLAATVQAAGIRSVATLASRMEPRLRGPALLSMRALKGLRRRVGKFRD